MIDNISVRIEPLPGSLKGFSVEKDDHITIMINECLDNAARIRTYEHEMEHIRNDDFHNALNADNIESIRH